MSSKKSASRAAVIERDEKPVEREGEEMNTKYVEQTQNRQAQKTQKAKNTEKKQREQPGRKEKAGKQIRQNREVRQDKYRQQT